MKRIVCLAIAVLILSGCKKSSESEVAADAVADNSEAVLASSGSAIEGEKVVSLMGHALVITPEIAMQYTEATGIVVQTSVESSHDKFNEMLIAPGAGMDLVFPSLHRDLGADITAKRFLPLDKFRLSNWHNLDSKLVEALQNVDARNEFLLPYFWGVTGLGFNVDAMRKNLGSDKVVDSWAAIFDATSVAKLSTCGVAILDDAQVGIGAAAIHLGLNPNDRGERVLAATTSLYQTLAPNIRFLGPEELIEQLANGGVCLAIINNRDLAQAQTMATQSNLATQLDFVMPKEGAMRWIEVAAIRADAAHPNNAHSLLNFLLQPEVMAPISNAVKLANTNSQASELVETSIRNDARIYPNAELLPKLVDLRAQADASQAATETAWQQIKAAK